MNLGDTIVAVSSPAGAGERAVLRLSGPLALAIADRVFVPAGDEGTDVNALASGSRLNVSEAANAAVAVVVVHSALPTPHSALLSSLPTHTVHPGRLSPPGAGLSVPALLYLMRGPRSYTREDVVEFHVGGWPAVVPLLVEGLVRAGARPAEPGEFTFRAFAGGRLDLAQAEAVMGVINAAGAAALRAAEDLLGGHLSGECSRLIDAVRDILALVEAGLDFSDQDIEFAPAEEIAARIDQVRRTLVAMARRSRSLETFGGEVRLVLAGWPNAGKSSLFNRLLEEDRAIVSPIAGTTRDELRAALHIGGLTFVLSDTAGIEEGHDGRGEGQGDAAVSSVQSAIRNPQSAIAVSARAKALEAIGRADLVLLVLDATAPSWDRAEDLLALAAAPMVVAISKCDLAPPDRARAWLAAQRVQADVIIDTSAATGQGLDDLRQALVRAVEGGTVDRHAAGPVLAARHRAALEQAAVALARAARVARRGAPAGELVAVELNESLEALGTIAGRKAGADILGEIFSRFCIGK